MTMENRAQTWFDALLAGRQRWPVYDLLQGELVAWEAGTLVCRYVASEAFANPTGHVQGGMLAAMLDDAMGTLAQSPLAAGQFASTLSLTVSFLRPARPGPVRVEARFVRQGSRILNVEGQALQDDKPVAQAVAVSLVGQAGG
nr:PaaI family thioesterase [Azotobacter vinelandii]WKN23684.1 PaaI family thioesterase [Azotobacter vinelandii]